MARTPGGTLSAFTLLSTPDEPTITSITTGIGSATVAFTAPTDVGDAAVSSYVVTAVDESSGASTGATGSASPITVTPPAGGTFKIRMQALNAYGPGRLTEFDTGNAIFSGAELYVWGNNGDGRLGDGTTINRSSPVQVGALTTWSQVASGSYHGAAVKTDGTLWTWGTDNNGQLGQNTLDLNKSSPVQVGALTTWSKIAAGDTHNLAIKSGGSLWAWGQGAQGRLGDGTEVSRSSPVQIGALTNWSQATGGQQHTAAIKTDGTLWTWGRNNEGALGDNTTANKSSPIQVGALTNWSYVSAGEEHTAAVTIGGVLYAWGNNVNGRLGDGFAGSLYNKSSPVQIGALTTWSRVSAGRFHTSAIKVDGTIWAWGLNTSGQLGLNDTESRSSPVQIGSLTNWSSVDIGGVSSSAIKTDGTVWTWGNNGQGRLGDNTIVSKSSPIQVGSLTNWVQTSVGSAAVIALYGVV